MDIDSAAGTQILKFGGNLKDVSYLQYELTALGYRLWHGIAPGDTDATAAEAESRSGRRRVHALVIGTGGGRDLLSALVFGAAPVDGVEINPIIVNDVMRDRFADYSGGVYERPNVRVAVEDGRSYVRRSPAGTTSSRPRSVDTWAATAAGAYSLSENSLYTVEAFDDYLDHLDRPRRAERVALGLRRSEADLAGAGGRRAARLESRRPPGHHSARTRSRRSC